MKVAIEGCCHGELDNIYETLMEAQAANGIKIDLLLICGDFQACRDETDLSTMACPQKYKSMQSFYKYYSGEKEAPVMTIFVGGNHEAMNHLWELPYGGWVAKNIFYLGYAGIVNFGGLRIGGISGIYNEHHYRLGHFESPPFNDKTQRSAYHVRQYEVFQLMQLKQNLDVFLSHDWPRGIAHHGDKEKLLRKKSFLREEVNNYSLGSPPGEEIMLTVRPRFWFSAHLHVKFAALVKHGITNSNNANTTATNQDKRPTETRFLALDKCLPHREFLQVLDFPTDETIAKEIQVDEEWMAILRSTAAFRSATRYQQIPDPNNPNIRSDFSATERELKMVQDQIKAQGSKAWPTKFQKTVEAYSGDGKLSRNVAPAVKRNNPQTEQLCSAFNLNNPCTAGSKSNSMNPPRHLPPPQGPPPPPQRQPPSHFVPAFNASSLGAGGKSLLTMPPPSVVTASDPNEISIDSDDDDDGDANGASKPVVVADPNEINLDSDDDDSNDGDASKETPSMNVVTKVVVPTSNTDEIQLSDDDDDDDDDDNGPNANSSSSITNNDNNNNTATDTAFNVLSPTLSNLAENVATNATIIDTEPVVKEFKFKRRNRNVATDETEK